MCGRTDASRSRRRNRFSSNPKFYSQNEQNYYCGRVRCRFAGAATFNLTELISSSTLTYVGGTGGSGYVSLSSQVASYAQTTPTAADVVTYLGSASTGLYSGSGYNAGSGYTGSGLSVSDESFSFTNSWSYQAYCGWYNAAVISVSDILAVDDTKTIDDLTTLSVSYSVEGAAFSVWTISTDSDGNTAATQLLYVGGSETCSTVGVKGTAVTTTVTGTLEADISALTETSTIVLLFGTNGNNEGNATVTATVTDIPEPSAFGLLAGIGALVLVAARRRSRKA